MMQNVKNDTKTPSTELEKKQVKRKDPIHPVFLEYRQRLANPPVLSPSKNTAEISPSWQPQSLSIYPEISRKVADQEVQP